jgi:hypothetical protein
MLSAFATTRTAISAPIAICQPRLKWTAISSPSVLPEASAVRSQISWTASINGNVTSATHSIEKPNRAPACA